MKFTSKYPTSRKQLDIVLNLNRLTKKGGIDWERVDRQEENRPARSIPVYEAEYRGHDVQVLYGDPPLETDNAPVEREPDSYWIRITGLTVDEIVIPPMPAVEDLVDTIERKAGLAPHQVNDPETLDDFNRLLEEEL